MEPRTERTRTVELAQLEDALLQRAWWYEDPEAYRAGVHDTVEALRRFTGPGADRVPVATAV